MSLPIPYMLDEYTSFILFFNMAMGVYLAAKFQSNEESEESKEKDKTMQNQIKKDK
jgi:hypothetical protein